MDLLRRAVNPWGQDVLIGVSWTLIWAAAVVGILFMVAHSIYVWRGGEPQRGSTTGGLSGGRASAVDETGTWQSVPGKVTRHTLASRLFHWTMVASVFALLITAFFPILDVRFDWVPLHYGAGVVLLGAVVYHTVHATFWQGLGSMWIGRADLREAWGMVNEVVGRKPLEIEKAGKYPVDHKTYHHVASIVTVAAIVTGVLMMFRVDTPFWDRSLYLFSDPIWGIIYVIHRVAGIALITLVMTHVYFALRPEKWWITRSMIKGWITRKEFLEHHDPARWRIRGAESTSEPRELETVAAGTVALDPTRDPHHHDQHPS